jgi:glycosyltransferase involved in cell wall biosynthesis
MDEHGRVSLVLPTYNRAQALRANLGAMLALREVAEVIVIDDGSTDETLEVCQALADERLRVISHPRNRGVAAARNTGIDAADGQWVLFGEDDCRFPSDYAVVLRQEAERHSAEIVGAPVLYLHATNTEATEVAEFAARAPRRATGPSMDEPNVFPVRAIQTPFLPAPALVRRDVFDRVRFYDGFPVNGYREETDFFVQAARAGFRCLLTPKTYCYQLDIWDGGQHHASSLRYEYWVLTNNWRFLRRHGSWLAAQGYIDGIRSAQLRFAGRRALDIAAGMANARVAAVRRVLPGGDPAPRQR